MRLAVIGVSCSGKSTLAKNAAEKLKTKYIEQDALFWRPGWQTVPEDEFRASMRKELESESWTTCGNHSAAQEMIYKRATDIIWLNYSFPLVFARALRRTCLRVFLKQPCCNGNYEGFRHAFLSKDSILWWILKTYKMRVVQYKMAQNNGIFKNVNFREFRSPKEAEAWLKSLSE